MLELPDDIAAASETPIPLPASTAGHSFMTGIRSEENPLESHFTKIDSQLASTATSALKTMAITWDRVRLAATSNQYMAALLHIIESGFPQFRHELPATLQEHYQFHDHLYTMDGVILYKYRIIVPPPLRQHILAALHSTHQGVTSMTVQAESTVFWPGITPAIASPKSQLWSLQPHGTFTTDTPTGQSSKERTRGPKA